MFLNHDFWPILEWSITLHNVAMKLFFSSITPAVYAAIFTWAVVFGVSLYWLSDAETVYQANGVLVSALFIFYIVADLAVTLRQIRQVSRQSRLVLLTLQLFSAFGIMWLVPLEFLPILTIIWVAALPFFFSLKVSIGIMFLVVLSWFLVFGYRWQQDDLFFSGLLYGSFHLFAVFANYQSKVAEEASLEALRLNKELQSTQGLLQQATRQNERTRIARDLHDLLGHHLTALIINLQVAGHITNGEAKEKVAQCHSLAKLLLSDVREAVSTLRENQALDFRSMVELMSENIPGIEVEAQIDAALELDDLALAKTLLSCIQEALTNSLRHSGANQFNVILSREAQGVRLVITDNGRIHSFIKGNGLLGFEERIDEHAGTTEFNDEDGSLRINAFIPDVDK